MSIQDFTVAARSLSVAEKLRLIERLTQLVQEELQAASLSVPSALSEESAASMALIQSDTAFSFLKEPAEDGYTLQHLKERR